MDKSKWEYKTIKDICISVEDGDWIESQDQSRDGIRLIQTGNVGIGEYLDKCDKSKYISEETFERLNCKEIFAGDCLISRLPDPIGRSCIIPSMTSRMITAVDCSILRFKDCVIANYFVQYTKSRTYNSDINRYATGATRKRISRKNLEGITIPVPSINDQQRIVAELDCLNEMIAVKQEQLKEFDTLAQSIFYDMFGDPMENSQGWKSEILANIVSEDCSISYGIVQPGEDVEDGVPVVRPVDLTSTIVYRNGLKVVDKAISDSYRRTILKGNEILFCVRGTTGIMSFASEELKGCNVTRGITPLSFSEKVDKTYIYYLLMTPYLQSIIAEKTNGIALKQINMRDVRLLPILLPPLALQQQFADKISAIGAQKELVKQSIAETQALLSYTMDKYFG